MVKAKGVRQTTSFKRAVKKLKANQKKDLDEAVKLIMRDMTLGEQKKGDLAYLFVYKFKMSKQLTLLGYSYEDGDLILDLLTLGSHENFYRDVKR